jgi:protein gp37
VRPFDVAWARSIIKQCHVAGVPVFVKQLGATPVADYGNHFLAVRDRKGGDMAEWPADLRVRELPAVTCG